MLILGFPIGDEDPWEDDPFQGYYIPEDVICEVCHIYSDKDGNRYIGIDMALGIPRSEMEKILLPFSIVG